MIKNSRWAEIRESKSVMTHDQVKISYDHYKANHKKVIVIAHGFFNSKQSFLLQSLGKELIEDYDVVLLDFRGHGKSGGFFYWTTKEHVDLIAVLEILKKDYDNIGIVGFSLGGSTSIIAANKTDLIDTLVCVGSPCDFDKIEYHVWDMDIENDILYNLTEEGKVGKGVRPGPFWLKKEKPIDCVDCLKCPILFLHGEKDWLIRPKHSRNLYKKANTKKDIVTFKDGPHAEYLLRENKNKKKVVDLVRSWLKETLT
ncbi:MAG: alpha/beta fold hydrolase [Candidatus Aceula lacicola]|nr:alpha/beta fold hydrolase [Candidatus Aceula lacicola]